MKKTLSLFFIFLTLKLFALDLQDCSLMAQHNGDIHSPLTLPKECQELVNQNKSFYTSSNKFQVYGSHNLFYILNEESTDLVAGKSTQLTKAIDAVIDEKNEIVFLLNLTDDQVQILSFPLTYGGNLVPRRVISFDKEEHTYSHMALDNDSKTLYLISNKDNSVQAFDLASLSSDLDNRSTILEDLDLSLLRKALKWQDALLLIYENKVEIYNPGLLESFTIHSQDLGFHKVYTKDNKLIIDDQVFELPASY